MGYDRSPIRGKHSRSEIFNSDNKIIKILYGFPKNPIRWPKGKRIKKDEKYLDLTDILMKKVKDNKLVITSGYREDHKRCKLIKEYRDSSQENNIIANQLNIEKSGPIYKEFVIIRNDGSEIHLSKWDGMTIHFD